MPVVPDVALSTLVVPAPGAGPHHWAGAPSAALAPDGTVVLAYRVRDGFDGTDTTVVARSEDGVRFEIVARLDDVDLGARWLERPTILLTPQGRWRLFVCCGATDSSRWWVEAIEADTLEELSTAARRVVFPGSDTIAVKDPVVRVTDGRWEAWLCCHLLDEPGGDDRMRTEYATSTDGWTWQQHGIVHEGTPQTWDARGVRVTGLLPDGSAFYDGRASRAENWFERSGLAAPTPGGRFAPVTGAPVVDVRYVEVLALAGGLRLYYEVRSPDESHELRTQLVQA